MTDGPTTTYILFNTDPGKPSTYLIIETDQYGLFQLVTLACDFVSEFSHSVGDGPHQTGALATEFVRYLEREGYDVWSTFAVERPNDVSRYMVVECGVPEQPVVLALCGPWDIKKPPVGVLLRP